MTISTDTEVVAATDKAPVRRYSWYALGVLVLVYTLNFIDRQIPSILAEHIKADLNLDDTQLGFLYGTVFAIFYTILGIPLGQLTDNWHRGRLMALGLVLWSGMTMLSGAATNYAQLAAARVGVGVGEASASPAAFSMLAGYFPQRRRALAMSIYSAGVYLGMGLSLPIGGVLADAWNLHYATGGAPLGLRGWQVAFFAVGFPGILLAGWVLALREPPRIVDGVEAPLARPGAWRIFVGDVAAILPPFTLLGAARRPGGLRLNLIGLGIIALAASGLILLTSDRAQWIAYAVGCYAVFSWSQALRGRDPSCHALLFQSRAVPLAVLGFGLLASVTYAYGFWAAPFAIRTFGLPAGQVGTWIGLPGAVASAVGVIAGGRLSDGWKRRDPRGRVFTCMLAAALPVPVLLLMFSAPDFRTYALLSPLAFLLINLWAGSAVATYQELVLPRMYGIVGAVYLLGSTMVGLALGPYVTGKIATVTGSLQTGVLSLVGLAPVTLFVLWQLSRLVEEAERDKDRRAADASRPPA